MTSSRLQYVTNSIREAPFDFQGGMEVGSGRRFFFCFFCFVLFCFVLFFFFFLWSHWGKISKTPSKFYKTRYIYKVNLFLHIQSETVL